MHLVIFVTASNKKETHKIAHELVKSKLCACVNIIGNVESVFWWQGKIDTAKEALLIIKSKRSKLNQIIKLIKSLHSYEVPEIIALPIIAGEKKYLSWLDDSVK